MPRMGKHSPAEAAGKRARACAWAVFISMAGTTMSFQVYHSIKHGDIPWPLAVLYGVVPLLVSMLLIEVVSGWEGAPKWIQGAAYLIIGVAMYLSAAATGAVVLKAAPLHSSLLFGLLLDGAAILAARFLMTAVKRAAAAERAEHAAALESERAARHQAEDEAGTLREELTVSAAREAALARQLEERQGGTEGGTVPPGRARHKSASAAPKSAKAPEAQAAEVLTRAEAEIILDAEPGISGSELGRRLNVQEGYGRKLKRDWKAGVLGGVG